MLTANIYAHEGDPEKIHACVRQNGRVRVVQPNNDCGQMNPPGAWSPIHWDIEGGDDDWSGAGTGSMHPSDLNDNVVVGAETGSAKLHISSDASDNVDALNVEPQGSKGLLVNAAGQVVIGEPSGTLARLAINSKENEDSFRARVNDITHFIVKSDGQTGVGTSTPDARLEINARQDEKPLQVRLQNGDPQFLVDADGNVGIGRPQPTDKLSVLQKGDSRAGFFEIDNSSNQSAALSAITRGNGSALFANILKQSSTAPALFARNSGSGPAAQFDRGDVRILNGNLGVGTSITDAKLSVLQKGDSRAGFFEIDNSSNQSAALSAYSGAREHRFWPS